MAQRTSYTFNKIKNAKCNHQKLKQTKEHFRIAFSVTSNSDKIQCIKKIKFMNFVYCYQALNTFHFFLYYIFSK